VRSHIARGGFLETGGRRVRILEVTLRLMVAVGMMVSAVANAEVLSPAQNETLYTRAPTFSGVALPGQEIVVRVDGVARAYGRANDDGGWIAAVPFDAPLTEGRHIAQVLGTTVSFIVQQAPAVTAACGRTLSPSLLAIAFGAWCVLRRREAQPQTRREIRSG
jgi:hypothetical protein